MKKVLIFSLVSLMLVACSNNKEDQPEDSKSKVEQSEKQEVSIKEGFYFKQKDDVFTIVNISKEKNNNFILNKEIYTLDYSKRLILEKNSSATISLKENKINIQSDDDSIYKLKNNKIDLTNGEESMQLTFSSEKKVNSNLDKFKKEFQVGYINEYIKKNAESYYNTENPNPTDNVSFIVSKIDDNTYNVNVCVEKGTECISENVLVFDNLKGTFNPKFSFTVADINKDKNEVQKEPVKEKIDLNKKVNNDNVLTDNDIIEKIKKYYDAEYGLYKGLNFKITSKNNGVVEVQAYEINPSNSSLVTIGNYYYNTKEKTIFE